MAKRNNLVEFARFIFSVLVIGYHVQMSFAGNGIDMFENGALAVEFFFLISGYFFARSIEKISANDKCNVVSDSCRFMGNKLKGVLPTHLTAVILMIVMILIFDLGSCGSRLLNGLPSIFLVQEAIIWNNAYANALIVPEWYLSSMLLCMLIMIPIALALRKKIKGVFVTLVLIGVLGVIAIIVGLSMNWKFTTTFVYDLRAWGEMCVGMFAYYLSTVLAKKEFDKKASICFKVIEVLGYLTPIILGIVPMSASLQPVAMVVAVVGVFLAISITFAGKGIAITNEKVNAVFGYLGSLSLAMYLFHPAMITMLDYAYADVENWAKYLIVFALTVALAILYNAIVYLVKKLIKNIKKPDVTTAV